VSRPASALERIAEVEWQMKFNRGLADIHRAAGTTSDSSLQRLLYRAKRKDLINAIYGTESQERRVA